MYIRYVDPNQIDCLFDDIVVVSTWLIVYQPIDNFIFIDTHFVLL